MRRFTVADDIGLLRFANGLDDPIMFSPDEQYVAVLAERGRVDLNRSESFLKVFRVEDVKEFLRRSGVSSPPEAVRTISISSYKEGPIISNVRWLADSSALAFLAKTNSGDDQLLLADIHHRTLQPLTTAGQTVTGFDVRSPVCYAYTVMSPAIRSAAESESRMISLVGTGRSIDTLLVPGWGSSPSIWLHDLSELWIVCNGRRFRVSDTATGAPLPIHLQGQRALALSPDGHSLITALTVRTIPVEWEKRFPSPFPSFPYRIRAGNQDPEAFSGQRDVSEYVLIDLVSETVRSLTQAPVGDSAGWWGISRADWSSDGESLVLANTFISPALVSEEQHEQPEPARPCVAVIDFPSRHATCVERLTDLTKGNKEEPWRLICSVRFVHGEKRAVTVEHLLYDGKESTTYHRQSNNTWTADKALAVSSNSSVDISAEQDLNSPPVLVALDRQSKISKLLWNPNPQLNGVPLGNVSILRWNDDAGRDWIAGLYKPTDYRNGRLYPLVIQNHGFDEHEFRPSGASTTAFAAQELAAAGFVVLQMRDCPVRGTPEEGPCQLAGYESAVRKLVDDRLVDPRRIGIIGFSRTCFYVLEALTASKVHFAAASITDGVNEGYLQYLLYVDLDAGNFLARDADAIIGDRPFAQGLQRWLQRSPEFNMDKVTTPLQVVAMRQDILEMWEPYAALRYLNKPVDLLILNSDEHVLTNPAERMASQGATVDWFRFWLNNEEDPEQSKAAQYARWRELRALRPQ